MAVVQRVCVIGAGVAGLACACAAAAAGCEVDVVSAAPALAGDPASQIALGPNAMRALETLGLGSAAAAIGFAYQGMSFVTGRGDKLFDVPATNLVGARLPAALGVRHTSLLALLADAASGKGARLHLGQRVELPGAPTPMVTPCTLGALPESERGVQPASSNNAPPASTPQGWLEAAHPHTASADLIVIAAGLDSALRPALFPAAPGAEDFAQHWWQALLPRPRALERATWVVGTGGRKLLMLPVSVNHAGVALPRPAAALAECVDAGVSRGAALRAALGFASALLPSLEGRLGDTAAVSVRHVRAALLPAPWHRGRVLCVGGFAHALPPHFAQATAQSLEDAGVLGELLRSGADRETLLAAFAARRPPRVARVHAIVSQAARWSQRPDTRTDMRALHAELADVVALPA